MNRPVLLDLFCGAGGAGRGYADAGFDVVGVDIEPQPHYPFEFHRADALDPASWGFALDDFDAVHASPPCQLFSQARLVKIRRNPDAAPPVNLIPQTRRLLKRRAYRYVIENVVGAPLIEPVRLCGSMFDLMVQRHRVFESDRGVELYAPRRCDHAGMRARRPGWPIGVYHAMGDQVKGVDSRTGRIVLGGRTASTLEEAQAAMGIDWMPWRPLTQAVPPAYTEHLGVILRRSLGY